MLSTAPASGAITSPRPKPHMASATSACRRGPKLTARSSACQPDISQKAAAASNTPASAMGRRPMRAESTPPRRAPTGTPARNRLRSKPESSWSRLKTRRPRMGTSTRATISAPPISRLATIEPMNGALRSRGRGIRGPSRRSRRGGGQRGAVQGAEDAARLLKRGDRAKGDDAVRAAVEVRGQGQRQRNQASAAQALEHPAGDQPGHLGVGEKAGGGGEDGANRE